MRLIAILVLEVAIAAAILLTLQRALPALSRPAAWAALREAHRVRSTIEAVAEGAHGARLEVVLPQGYVIELERDRLTLQAGTRIVMSCKLNATIIGVVRIHGAAELLVERCEDGRARVIIVPGSDIRRK